MALIMECASCIFLIKLFENIFSSRMLFRESSYIIGDSFEFHPKHYNQIKNIFGCFHKLLLYQIICQMDQTSQALFQATLQSLTCPNHPNDQITFLCITCSKIYNCTQCISRHPNCQIVMVKQALIALENTFKQSNSQSSPHTECFSEELGKLFQLKQTLINASISTAIQLIGEFNQKQEFYKEKKSKLERNSKVTKETLTNLAQADIYLFNSIKMTHEQTNLLLTLVKHILQIDGEVIFAGKVNNYNKLKQLSEFQQSLNQFVKSKFDELKCLIPSSQERGSQLFESTHKCKSKSHTKSEERSLEEFTPQQTPSTKRYSLNQSFNHTTSFNNYSVDNQYDFLGTKKPIQKGMYHFSNEEKSSKINVYCCNTIARLGEQDNYYSSRGQRTHRVFINPAFQHGNVLRKQSEIKFRIVNLVSYSQIAIGIMKRGNDKDNEFRGIVIQIIDNIQNVNGFLGIISNGTIINYGKQRARSFAFMKGDIITLKFDPFKRLIIFIKNSLENYQIPIEFSAESIEQWLGVVFLSEVHDEIEILN